MFLLCSAWKFSVTEVNKTDLSNATSSATPTPDSSDIGEFAIQSAKNELTTPIVFHFVFMYKNVAQIHNSSVTV